MSILGFLRRNGKGSAQAVPRTLSQELLEDLTSSCPLAQSDEDDRREHLRICIGTRAMLRPATPDSTPVSIMLRDISASGVGLLVDSPLPIGKEYWIYVPKAENTQDIVALCCVIARCDAGGFERSYCVAGATFIEGEPPALPPPPEPPVQAKRPPNQFEEEGLSAPHPRPGSAIFLPSQDSTADAEPDAPQAPPAASPAPMLSVPKASETAEEPEAPVHSPAPMPSAPLVCETLEEPEAPAHSPAPISSEPTMSQAAEEPEAFVSMPTPSAPLTSDAPSATVAPTTISAPISQPTEQSAEAAPLTPAQIRKMAQSVQSQRAHLKRLANRFDKAQLAQDDPRRQGLRQAEQALEQLQASLQPTQGATDPPAPKRTRKRSSKRRQPKPEKPQGQEHNFFLRESAIAISN